MIQLKYQIINNNLYVKPVDDMEYRTLKELFEEDPERFISDECMHEVFERMVANSALEWISPSENGDLTDAPMLGIKDANDVVISRWAYMEYESKSPLEDMIHKGQVIFHS